MSERLNALDTRESSRSRVNRACRPRNPVGLGACNSRRVHLATSVDRSNSVDVSSLPSCQPSTLNARPTACWRGGTRESAGTLRAQMEVRALRQERRSSAERERPEADQEGAFRRTRCAGSHRSELTLFDGAQTEGTVVETCQLICRSKASYSAILVHLARTGRHRWAFARG